MPSVQPDGWWLADKPILMDLIVGAATAAAAAADALSVPSIGVLCLVCSASPLRSSRSLAGWVALGSFLSVII